MFGSSAFDVAAGLVFAAILTGVCFSDLRWRRISNALVLITALTGVSFTVGHAGHVGAVLASFAGAALGLAIWLPCYWLRMMGAGDVKFFAAASTWLGAGLTIHAAALSALFGGVLAIGWMCWLRSTRDWVGNDTLRFDAGGADALELARSIDKRKTLPYGVAMAGGLAVVAWFPNILR